MSGMTGDVAVKITFSLVNLPVYIGGKYYMVHTCTHMNSCTSQTKVTSISLMHVRNWFSIFLKGKNKILTIFIRQNETIGT